MFKFLATSSIVMLLSAPASAAVYNISVTGTLTSQGSQYDYNCGCIATDANLSIGSQIVLTASFDAAMLIPWGDTGYSVAALGGLPTDGNSFFRIDGPGMRWQALDDESDGFTPIYKQYDDNVQTIREYGPAIIIQGDKVAGIANPSCLSPTGSGAPELCPGSNTGSQTDWQVDGVDHFMNQFNVNLSDTFFINNVHGRWGNFYETPGFTGVWDFASSSAIDPPSLDSVISAAPEPGTWTMFLLGFGAVGYAMRRQALLAASKASSARAVAAASLA